MRKIETYIIFLILIFLTPTLVEAQKFGYVNTELILDKIPEYKKVQDELEGFTQAWQKDIEEKQLEITTLYNSYVAEKIILTAEMKQKKEEEIAQKEKELQEFQTKIFGVGGLFFLKKQELIKPLQDKIFEAVNKVAKTHRLAIIFDKASDLMMIYTDPRHDYTDFVLEELGLGDPHDVVK